MVVGTAIRRTIVNKASDNYTQQSYNASRSYAFDPRLSYVDNRQKGRSSLSYMAEQALPFILIGGAGYLILRNKFGVKSETLDKITDKGGDVIDSGLGTVGNLLNGAESLTSVFDTVTGKFAEVANNAINKDYSGFLNGFSLFNRSSSSSVKPAAGSLDLSSYVSSPSRAVLAKFGNTPVTINVKSGSDTVYANPNKGNISSPSGSKFDANMSNLRSNLDNLKTNVSNGLSKLLGKK